MPSTRCKKCGAVTDQVARFCVDCGTPFDSPPVEALGPERSQTKPEVRGPQSRRTLKLDIGGAFGGMPEGGPPGSMSEALAGAKPPSQSPASKKPPSLRPEPDRKRPPSDDQPPISDILGQLDSSFEEMFTSGPSQPAPARAEDMNEAQMLFKSIVSEYAAPVRGFLIELRPGDASKDWIQICMPSVASMAESAKKMGLASLADAFSALRGAFENAEAEPGLVIGGAARARLLTAFAQLKTELPEAFEVERELEQREPIIVRSLLCQVAGVRKVQLDRIYRAGLTSLAMFAVASPRELAETTGLELELCDRVVNRFKRYRSELLEGPGDAARSADVGRIENLAAELQKLNAEYEDDKKRVRARRTELMHEVNVLLARLGEVELIEQLERMPFQKKASELERFVKERRERAK